MPLKYYIQIIETYPINGWYGYLKKDHLGYENFSYLLMVFNYEQAAEFDSEERAEECIQEIESRTGFKDYKSKTGPYYLGSHEFRVVHFA